MEQFTPKAAWFTLFLSARETFSWTEDILEHKTNVNKFTDFILSNLSTTVDRHGTM